MILEQETFDAFGYYPKDLKSQSAKKILAACDGCGKIRALRKSAYHPLCKSCAAKGHIVTEETRRKLSEASNGRIHTEEAKQKLRIANTGARNPMFGKHFTDTVKEKISNALKGDKNPNFGKHFTEEHKAKIGNANKGKTLTDEAKRKMSEAKKGKILSKKTKQKMSEAKKGITFTEEHKAKIGETHKGDKAYNWKGGQKMHQARARAKRRQLGFTPLNTPFEDVEAHHITHDSVVYIPKALHHSIWHNMHTGQGMAEMNAVAIDFLIRGII